MPPAARFATFAMTACVTLLCIGTSANAATPDYPPTSVTAAGHVYLDTNGNGTQDPGEPDLPSVDVIVSYTADECVPVAEVLCTQTVTTDSNGNWTAAVAEGEATADIVESTLPAGVTQTEGTDPTVFTAVAGQIADGGTDGYVPAGTVSGHIYLDNNGNGTQDPGEPNLPGVEILITDSDGGTQIVTTDANGNWTASVPPGATTANVDESTLPEGVTQTEGDDTTTATAITGVDTLIMTNGYTPDDGDIPDTGSDSTIGGLRLGGGMMLLGAGLVGATRLRRRQPALA